MGEANQPVSPGTVFTRRTLVIVAGVVIAAGLIFIAVLAYLATQAKGLALPSARVGSLPIGGLSREEVRMVVADMQAKLAKEGVEVMAYLPAGSIEFRVYPEVTIDAAAEAERLVAHGNQGALIGRGWQVLASRWQELDLTLKTVAVDSEGLLAAVSQHLAPYQSPPVNAAVRFKSVEPLVYEITTSSAGTVFKLEDLPGTVVRSWSVLAAPSVTLEGERREPEITEADIEAGSGRLPALFAGGAVTLTYHDETLKKNYSWKITPRMMADWLEPYLVMDGGVDFRLNRQSLQDFFDNSVTPKINAAPENARFSANESLTKVIEFTPSRPGITLDAETTAGALSAVLSQRAAQENASSTFAVAVTQVKPEIATAQTNNLGIAEVLGVGYSNFSGSPRNRILNIKNAVKNKLHGTLVKPGEEFSLVGTLKPFTLDAGYLPELVILGNRITPEIAGGLCQVGTTMFRAAMNSALPITARTNHGLVVSYYNDPANGNPGTDATIYEPWPDFRFKYDTDKYLLITTEMNTATGDLVFTVWGTNDGRKGYYTAPKVLQWFPAGPAQTIETTDLPPGKKECQGVHNGATAAFNYIRELATGEKITREFKSTYRAVPSTCYVGAAKKPDCAPDDAGCVPEQPAESDTPAESAETQTPPAEPDSAPPAETPEPASEVPSAAE